MRSPSEVARPACLASRLHAFFVRGNAPRLACIHEGSAEVAGLRVRSRELTTFSIPDPCLAMRRRLARRFQRSDAHLWPIAQAIPVSLPTSAPAAAGCAQGFRQDRTPCSRCILPGRSFCFSGQFGLGRRRSLHQSGNDPPGTDADSPSARWTTRPGSGQYRAKNGDRRSRGSRMVAIATPPLTCLNLPA